MTPAAVMRPAVGRIVHYLDGATCCAAIVTGVNPEAEARDTTVELQVFHRGHGIQPKFAVFEGDTANTWHWHHNCPEMHPAPTPMEVDPALIAKVGPEGPAAVSADPPKSNVVVMPAAISGPTAVDTVTQGPSFIGTAEEVEAWKSGLLAAKAATQGNNGEAPPALDAPTSSQQ